MIPIQRDDFESLVKAGLIKFSKMDKNFQITNRQKKGSRKKYYVVEERKILNFLNIKKVEY